MQYLQLHYNQYRLDRLIIVEYLMSNILEQPL